MVEPVLPFFSLHNGRACTFQVFNIPEASYNGQEKEEIEKKIERLKEKKTN